MLRRFFDRELFPRHDLTACQQGLGEVFNILSQDWLAPCQHDCGRVGAGLEDAKNGFKEKLRLVLRFWLIMNNETVLTKRVAYRIDEQVYVARSFQGGVDVERLPFR